MEIGLEWVEMEHGLEIVVSTMKSSIHGKSRRANCTIILRFKCCRISCKRVLKKCKIKETLYFMLPLRNGT